MKINTLRKTALSFLKRINRDIYIRHHLTKKKFYLNLYRHKGYWYHGKNRKANSINIFSQWIKPGYKVLEIGGHIGYFSTFFAQLAEQGHVVVFEPDRENAGYLERNVEAGNFNNIEVIQKGAGNGNEELDFYMDPITGQNSTFIPDFNEFYENRKNSGSPDAEMRPVKINVVKLDDYCYSSGFFPDFVKIDVEGYEWNVILGFISVIEKTKPKLMVEVQQSNSEKIIQFFKKNNYSIFNDELVEIKAYEDYVKYKTSNLFFRPDR